MSKHTKKMPDHIAIIMDGNGRWANKRFLPRVAGHKEGLNAVERTVQTASAIGIKVLTLYAFSTENWSRPSDEVHFLMKLPIDFFNRFVPQLIEQNVRVVTIGTIEDLPQATQNSVNRAVELTKECTGMTLCFALNYGAQDDLLRAFQTIQSKELSEPITKETIAAHLSTHVLAPFQAPDLLIRTSGEIRLSNFLLWESAYSELYFIEKAWPDFTGDDLKQAINHYMHRERRYGGLFKGGK
ncbi:isoprenyl transferase [Atopobacter phocae]|uniref:isoprenyl transferase n=1 Tax=Atopobacter phocae TaxID=136492 RepID=UPI0004B5BC27|nr:isoprenyl transferase [Atopobacter phocae]